MYRVCRDAHMEAYKVINKLRLPTSPTGRIGRRSLAFHAPNQCHTVGLSLLCYLPGTLVLFFFM